MPKFQCPNCTRTLRADDAAIGKTVACPCGKKLRVPGVAQHDAVVQAKAVPPAQPSSLYQSAAQPVPAQTVPAQPVPAQPVSSSTAPSHISIQCNCGKRMKVAASARGKQVRCPECQSILTVPGGVEPATAIPVPDVFEADDPFADAGVSGASSGSSQQDEDWLGSLPPAEAAPSGALDHDFSSSAASTGSQFGSSSNYQSPNQTSSANRYLANAEADMRQKQRADSGGEESSFWDAGTGMGVLMMVGALVWFFGGLALGILFYYPPILFIAGLISFVRGLLD